MSLHRLATEVVRKLGRATADDVHPHLEEFGYTRTQVIKALHNAKDQGFLHSDGHRSRLGVPVGSPCPTTFLPGPNPGLPAKRERVIAPRQLVCSVFDLADPKTTIPAPPEVRKINTPLGPWNTEGA